ncbi:MAG: DUF177 domain-containing protein [Candidatus Omnitrophica bacterium]|nr:DUF177 domain-containing protein [Candidatus Omnitrophota bacterium]
MKIEVNQISIGGSILEQDFSPAALELEIDIIKFRGPIKARADVSRITNAVTVLLSLKATMYVNCSRCLKEFDIDLNKEIELNYPVSKREPKIDLDPDIRDQIILDYPIKPLCSEDCKGLCAKCGKNLNEGGCSCGTT